MLKAAMQKGIRLSEFIELHGRARSLSDAPQHPAYLWVERHLPSSSEARYLTTLGPSSSNEDAPTEDVLIFPIVAGSGRSDTVTLGRTTESDLGLEDPVISKTQLLFQARRDGATFEVSDPGSQNGTKLNGELLSPGEYHPLRDGDVLEIAERYRATFLSPASLHFRIERLALPSAPPSASVLSDGSGRGGLLQGKVAVITGAGRGVGRAYAHRFAEEGCAVVVNDNGAAPDGTGSDFSVAASVVAEIEQAGGRAVVSTHDVSVRSEVEALFRLAEQRFGGVDIMAYCAGALCVGRSVLEVDDDEWQRQMRINAQGTFMCLQRAARHMVEQKKPGRILTTGSVLAMNGNPGIVTYSASKSANYGLMSTAAIELSAHGITVNMITPMAWTRLTNSIPAIAAIPRVDELLSPQFVADVALFLVSDLAAGVTGQLVDVSGIHVSTHRMQQSAAAQPQAARWTPQELHRHWAQLTQA
jgi:NAD(P)-dependent dehydrogenase (short-subunit alcohol dehydrogenase family)